jgi:hypothetical protein
MKSMRAVGPRCISRAHLLSGVRLSSSYTGDVGAYLHTTATNHKSLMRLGSEKGPFDRLRMVFETSATSGQAAKYNRESYLMEYLGDGRYFMAWLIFS